ncbi:MAG: hypothetical protein ABSG86_25740 [Thermoguttaceae bacterium]|jgi:hypothetical protein
MDAIADQAAIVGLDQRQDLLVDQPLVRRQWPYRVGQRRRPCPDHTRCAASRPQLLDRNRQEARQGAVRGDDLAGGPRPVHGLLPRTQLTPDDVAAPAVLAQYGPSQ